MSIHPQDLAQLIEESLLSAKHVHKGRLLGAASVGGKVQVLLPYPLPKLGRVVKAIALNNCVGGEVTLFKGDAGKWYCLSNQSQELVQESFVRHRHYKRQSANLATYPFKVLFSVVEDERRKFYIGGDRVSKLNILDIPSDNYLISANISNTGKSQSNWVVGIQYIDADNKFITKNISPTSTWTQADEPWVWRQNGFWTYRDAAPLPNILTESVLRDIKYDVSFSYENIIIDNIVVGGESDGGCRIYDLPTNQEFTDFELDFDNIDSLIQLPINYPNGNYIIFPKIGGQYQGIDFFSGLNFVATNTFIRFNNSYENLTITQKFDPKTSHADGTGTQFFSFISAGQGDVFGGSVDQIGNESRIESTNINGSIKYKSKYFSTEAETTGTVKYCSKSVVALRSRKGRNEPSGTIAFTEPRNAFTLQETRNNSIVLPGVEFPAVHYKGESFKSFQVRKAKENNREITTVLTSPRLGFALCAEKQYAYSEDQISGQLATYSTQSSTSYLIVNSTKEKIEIIDPLAETNEKYIPDVAIDTLISRKGKKQIVRVMSEVLPINGGNITPVVFQLEATGESLGFELARQSNNPSFKVLSLKVEDPEIHSVSFFPIS